MKPSKEGRVAIAALISNLQKAERKYLATFPYAHTPEGWPKYLAADGAFHRAKDELIDVLLVRNLKRAIQSYKAFHEKGMA